LGKRLLIYLSQDDAIVFEPRMTGLVLLADPPDESHLRLGLRLAGGPAEHLWYWDRRGLGSVRLLSTRQRRRLLGPERLGPDALSVDADQLPALLGGSRRAIKVALLDQRTLAGIGNLYASEILHVAGVHPEKRCDLISRGGWRRIAVAMQQVLREAIHYEGSTLSDGTYRNALNQSGRYQNHHRVYSRQGQPCPRCREGRIRRIVQAQRSTFFCPRCQTKSTGR
jgi:formamidopyrimidine-DNA glycosylase